MSNELIFLLTILAEFFVIASLFRFGKPALTAIIAVNIILVVVFGSKIVAIFGLSTNAGNVFYASIFLAVNILIERYGKKSARAAVWTGFLALIFFVAAAQLTVILVGQPASLAANSAIHALFNLVPRIAFASMLAYLLAQHINIWLYSLMQKLHGQRLMAVRNIFSQLVAEIVDSLIFFSLAFWKFLSVEAIMQAVLVGLAIKMFVALLSTPVLYLSRRMDSDEQNETLGFLPENYAAKLSVVQAKTSFLRGFLLAALVFVLMAAGSVSAWYFTKQTAEQHASRNFQNQALQAGQLVQNRLNLYINALTSAKGLFAASDMVTRAGFHNYFTTYNVFQNYPGISAISFVKYVKEQDKQAFVQSVRKDTSLHPEGYPGFNIHPESHGHDYYVLLYFEPGPLRFATSTNFGMDLSAYADRMEAVSRAQSTGQPAITKPTVALNHEGSQDLSSFIIYEPVYSNQSPMQKASPGSQVFLGTINGVFQTGQFFSSVFNGVPYQGDFNLVVSDMASHDIIYSSKASVPGRLVMSKNINLDVAGRAWQVSVQAPAGFGLSLAEKQAPVFILLFGLILSVLVSAVLFSLASSRFRAVFLAQEMTNELAQSKNQLVEYIDRMSTFNAKLSTEGKFFLVNKAAALAFGIEEKQLAKINFLKGPWWDFDPEVAKRVAAAFARAVLGQTVVYDEQVKVASGDILFINFSLVPVLAGDKVKYIVAEGRDITKQKQNEKELENANNLLESDKAKDEALLQSIGEGLIVVDKQGRVEHLSYTAQQLLGINGGEAFGQLLWDVVAMQDEYGQEVPSSQRPAALTLATGEKYLIDGLHKRYYYLGKNKRKFPVSVTIMPVMVKGKLAGAVEIFRDLTEQLVFEQAKSDFVALASHQLRTPITAVNWFAEILLDDQAGVLNESQKDYVKQIAASGRRMEGLINELLNASRLEVGNIVVVSKKLNLSQLSHIILTDALREFAQNKHLDIEEIYQPQTLLVRADETFLGIILRNLLANAIMYTPAGGKVSLKIEEAKKNINHPAGILITVADTGYGIPKEQQVKVFSEMFRGGNVTSKDPNGKGLALYIVQLIVKRLAGKIWFESQEGKGSVFYVLLPKIP